MELDRRQFLIKVGVGVVGTLLLACTGNKEKSASISTNLIRREEGSWTREEALILGNSMLNETEFREIPYAGSLIVENLQEERSFSRDHSLFVDDSAIRIETKVRLGQLNENFVVLAGALIQETGPTVTFTLSNSIPDEKVLQNKTRLEIKKVVISSDRASDNSDFYLKFIVAKEIMNVRAFQMVADYISAEFSSDLPQYTEQKDAFVLYLLKRGGINRYSEMPLTFMADAWAQFLMIPDYMRARDLGKFTQKDLRDLFVFDVSSRYFTANGILIKTDNGDYEWIQDHDKLIEHWIEAAARSHAAISGVPPPSNNH